MPDVEPVRHEVLRQGVEQGGVDRRIGAADVVDGSMMPR